MPLNNSILQTRLQSKLIAATRAMDAASGDVAYTGAGFTPSKILVLALQDGTKILSVGFSDQLVAPGYSIQAKNDVSHFWTYSATSVIQLIEDFTNKSQYASLKSYDSDGFTLTWVRQGVTAAGTANLLFLCEA